MMKNFFPILTFLSLLSLAVSAQDSGGPDDYGYTWKSNKDLTGGVTASWIDLTTKPGAIRVTDRFTDDSNFGPINFSFDFPYYWYKRNQLWIGSNGYICFNNAQIAAPFPNIPIPGGVADDYLAPFMTDLTFTDLSGNRVTGAELYFYTDFKDTVIVSWLNVPFFNSAGVAAGGSHSFQAILVRDGSIIYQYLNNAGQQDAQACALTATTQACIIIGIENVSGKVGLKVKRDDDTNKEASTYLATSSATTPVAIKFFPPASSSYSVRDAAVAYNNNPDNGGVFVVKGSAPVAMRTDILNQGLVTTPSMQVTGKVFPGSSATALSTTSMVSGVLPANADTFLTFPGTIATGTAGIYRFESTVNWPNPNGDEITGNNKMAQQVTVVDTAAVSINLDYHDNTAEGGVSFVGAQPTFNVGLGNYIEFPYYPVEITHINAYLENGTGTGPIASSARFELYDDDGVNLFGFKDGSPGTQLAFKEELPVALAEGSNKIALTTPVQINSGGVYVVVLQGGSGVGIQIDETPPIAYRSYEVTKDVQNNKAFLSTYRERILGDPMIGLEIKKGNMNKVIDLSVNQIVKPTPSDVITAPADVQIEIKNLGPNAIAGPFEVGYKADNRPEEVDTIPSSVSILPGQTYVYTFTTKSAPPPPPRTQYNTFCTRASITNDFNLVNDTLCYTTASGIQDKELAMITIYPNPATEQLHILYGLKSTSDVEIELIDMVGRRVHVQSEKNAHAGMYDMKINLSDLKNGLYTCRIHTKNGFYTEKLMIFR